MRSFFRETIYAYVLVYIWKDIITKTWPAFGLASAVQTSTLQVSGKHPLPRPSLGLNTK